MATPQKPLNKTLNFFSTIHKYDCCLGQGGFGMVLKATINSSEIPTVAVKFLFHPTGTNEKELKKLIRESKITINLEKHENVVKIMSAVEKELTTDEIKSILSDKILQNNTERDFRDYYAAKANRTQIQAMCIQMELCGENLRMWLKKHNDIENVSVQLQQMTITKNLIAGLTFLHDNKIIHRDLKPENIMFSSTDYRLPAKIGDFGLSRKLPPEGAQTLTSNVGTRNYMAPEVRSGRKDYNYQADLFSLGLIIWEIVQCMGTPVSEDLVYDDDDESLSQDHPLMVGVKALIIRLTKRRTVDRVKSMHDDDVIEFNDRLGHNVWEKAAWSNKLTKLQAKNSAEFELWLEYAKSGCRILLTEGIYEGPFILKPDSSSLAIEAHTSIGIWALIHPLKFGSLQLVYGCGCGVAR